MKAKCIKTQERIGKTAIVFILAVTIFPLPSVGDEQTDPERLSVLRDSYDREVQRAVSPITKKYLAALQSLKQVYTKAGDLEAAIAFEKEISRIEGTDADSTEQRLRVILTTSVFVLHWGVSKDKKISFLPDGTVGTGQNDWEHAWKIENGELHILKRQGNTSWIFAYEDSKGTLMHSSTPHELDDQRASLKVSK